MVSSGAWYWTGLVVVTLCFEGTHTVTVNVKSPVVTDQRAGQVILPCEYKLENPNQRYNIRWDTERNTVIVKDSLDQLIYGDKYNGRVKWGEGCSLVLLSPGLNDTGRYRFNIAALEDQVPWKTVYVNLIVTEARTGDTTMGVSGIPQSTGSTPRGTSTEDGQTTLRWEDFVPMAIIALANLIAQSVFMPYNERHGLNDIRWRLCLGSVIVLLVIGVITAGLTMALRSRTVLLVSSVTITLGVVIQWICVLWIIKRQESIITRPSITTRNSDFI